MSCSSAGRFCACFPQFHPTQPSPGALQAARLPLLQLCRSACLLPAFARCCCMISSRSSCLLAGAFSQVIACFVTGMPLHSASENYTFHTALTMQDSSSNASHNACAPPLCPPRSPSRLSFKVLHLHCITPPSPTPFLQCSHALGL